MTDIRDRFRIVEIEWFDSTGMEGVWELKDGLDTLSPSPIVTVGYLWETTKDAITICQSQSRTQVARRFTIPRGCIKRIRTIRK